ncbi:MULTISPECIES: energy transducer TonB [unclassified Colwellia]|uniref:energy transducer TonB n=1 Tax=unclassified Colwellia TaxID=196834 RepID=UPI0015F7153B|nr:MULTISPECIES: energy transducer TonB [unclassified Colwellia]MBA6231387.1 energy transducer TonB [Colwellia sp. MB02u-7]MBA6235637.1 energy transducer TonB [Colwellia sp. MB02u-11]MBA6297982.1 energy transducer TonB [Colwellia sp. MB3u-22]MBA6309642.1 energy transducer TonB [Colwellia sp. MB3u-64]
MKHLSLLLIIVFFTVACSSKHEASFDVPAITIKDYEIQKYWVPTKNLLSFDNNFRQPKESGFVRVQILIDSKGEIFNPVIIESKGGWDKFALRALKEIHYVSTEFNISKTPVYVIKEFRFLAP